MLDGICLTDPRTDGQRIGVLVANWPLKRSAEARSPPSPAIG